MKQIKIAGLVVEVPDNSPLLVNQQRAYLPKIEAQDEQLERESPSYVFQPNDPFQANVDQIKMLGNVGETDKKWVQNAFFVFLLLLPFVVGELFALHISTLSKHFEWRVFVLVNVLVLGYCYPFFRMWTRRRKKTTQKEA